MHTSAIILALLSASTLAVPVDNGAPPATQPAISANPHPQQNRLGAQLTSWPTDTCGKDGSASGDGKSTDVRVESGCIKFAPSHDYVRLKLYFGQLEVFENEGCTGRLEMRSDSTNGDGDRCIEKGKNHWGSVRLSKSKDARAPSASPTHPHPAPRSAPAPSTKPALHAIVSPWSNEHCRSDHPIEHEGIVKEMGPGCHRIDHQMQFFHLVLNYGMVEVFSELDCKGISKGQFKAMKENQPLQRCLYRKWGPWASANLSEPKGTEWVAPPK